MEGDDFFKKKNIFAVLCVIASLISGILISFVLVETSLLIVGAVMRIATFIIFILLATITYFSLSFFEIREKNIFWIMFVLGILISLSYFLFNVLIGMGFDYLQPAVSSNSFALVSLFSRPQSSVLSVLIILFSYIFFPLWFLIRNK